MLFATDAVAGSGAPTTPPVSAGPQTISSFSGASQISCAQYGNVGSSPGGSAVSVANGQVWMVANSNGCLGLFSITGDGEIVTS